MESYIEQLPKSLRFKRVSFKNRHQTPIHKIGKSEHMCHTRVHEMSRMDKMPSLPSSYQSSLEPEAESPVRAMEFLSRSWSPFASDFLPIFSSKEQSLPLYENNSSEEQEEITEVEGTQKYTSRKNISTANMVDNLKISASQKDGQDALTRNLLKLLAQNQPLEVKAWLTNQRNIPSHPLMHKSPDSDWIDLKYLKKWLRQKALTGFLRSHKERKRDEVRFHRAQLHAALSVAGLAAAVTGFVANNITEEAQTINIMTSEDARTCNKNMAIVVATAAALVATVCAEAAESAGADKACVASIINSGLATQTPADMIALTANAATCNIRALGLRGASTLKSRATADPYFPNKQELLKLGAKLSVVTSSGARKHKWASICLKCKKLMLRLAAKYLGGVLTTSKEYVIEECKRAQDYNVLSLETNRGNIKLLFEGEKQLIVWITTISNLLQIRNSI